MALSEDHRGAMAFTSVPNELMFMFADELEIADLNALARTSRAENTLLTTYIYRRAKDVRTRGGRPFFFVAVDHGNLTAAKRFIDAGVSVNMRGAGHETALHRCAETGNISIAELLIDNGAKVSAADNTGYTPLHLAITGAYRSEEMTRLLIEGGADILAPCRHFGSVLHMAATYSTASIVQLLLDRGVDGNVIDRDGSTPLHRAGTSGTPATVRLLLAAGLDVEATNSSGRTPLHCAAQYGKAESVQALLNSGAYVMASDIFGNTPLHLALRYRGTDTSARRVLRLSAAIPETLRQAKLDAATAARNAFGCPIMVSGADIEACMGSIGDIDDTVIKLLLAAGADIAAKNAVNCSPLLWALFTVSLL